MAGVIQATEVESDHVLLKERDVQFRIQLRMEVDAASSETLVNPLHRPQIDWIISDGSLVSSGQPVVVFSPLEVYRQLTESRFNEAIMMADMAKDATAESDKDLTRRDELAELEDARAVLETRLVRLRALPEPAQVRIAEGQFRVAELEAEAAARDLARGRDRFERGMISEAELNNLMFTRDEREAARIKAERMLAYSRKPARKSEIQQVALKIANAEIDIQRKKHEIEQNEKILQIQRKGTAARRAIQRKRIREAEEAVDLLELKAPRDGYVTYKKGWRERYLEGGRNMHRGMAFLNMPDHTQVVLKGSIRERDRQYLAVGDKALVRVSAHEGQSYGAASVVTGRVDSISVLSRDQGEKDEQEWGGAKQTGIKVYDIHVVLDMLPDWLRLGMHADVELVANRTVRGVAVPAGYLTLREDGYYLGVDGELQQVAGRLVGGYFLLQNEALIGHTATLFAKPKASMERDEPPLKGVLASGELIPMDVEPVRVADIGRWVKIAWIVPENTEVKAGDVVIRLDDEEVNKRLLNQQSVLEQRRSQTRTQEERDELESKLAAWELEHTRNEAEIARLKWLDKRDYRDEPSILSGSNQVQRAEIKLARLNKQYERSAAKGHRLLSPLAKRRLERDLKRAKLSLEAAKINLQERLRGPLPTDLRREELRYLDALRDAKDLELQQAFNAFSRERSLDRARRDEADIKWSVEKTERSLSNHVIYSPRDGIVRYCKVWDGGGISKVRPGSTVGQRMHVMDIAGISKMAVRVGMAERYYGRVSEGLKVHVRLASAHGVVLDGVVEEVEFLFEECRRKDTTGGIYSTQESLGETQFFVRVRVEPRAGITLKPGTMAEVIFPFNGEDET
jgi:multidrug resistance efflux pump